ncbi:MAG: redoxin domain-containing protein [Planctomycetes bacterium]|nr:redoxin domain-containing protein [Planctomycetota bacterium]
MLPSVLCLTAVLAAAGPEAPLLSGEKVKTLEIGARAPDFDLPGTDGKKYSLRSFDKSPVLVVIFTCNHCPTAQSYEERIKKIVDDYKDRGVAVVAISSNDPKAVRPDELGYTDLGDTFEEMKIRTKHKEFNFPYLYDGDKLAAAQAYGPRVTPHVFIFDRERRLRYVGRIDDSETGRRIRSADARSAIDALLAGRPVPVETTRAFGCSLKWPEKRAGAERFQKALETAEVKLEKIDAAGVADLRKNAGGKLRLINVWATWCGPCVTELPELVTIHSMYKHRQLELVTISIDLPGKSGEVLPFLEKRHVSGSNHLYDSEDRDALAEALDETWTGSIPFTLLVKPGGEIAYRREGAIDPLEVRRQIVKSLAPWRED